MDYFFSWRSYKLILARLNEVHGLKRRYTPVWIECNAEGVGQGYYMHLGDNAILQYKLVKDKVQITGSLSSCYVLSCWNSTELHKS